MALIKRKPKPTEQVESDQTDSVEPIDIEQRLKPAPLQRHDYDRDI